MDKSEELNYIISAHEKAKQRQRLMNLQEVKSQQQLGKLGESVAASFLQKRGFTIVERNFRIRYGEIDIIAKDHDTLVFVEVKTRSNNAFGEPEEAITPKKFQELMKTSQIYTMIHQISHSSQRIDVVAIRMRKDGFVEAIRYIENASL